MIDRSEPHPTPLERVDAMRHDALSLSDCFIAVAGSAANRQ